MSNLKDRTDATRNAEFQAQARHMLLYANALEQFGYGHPALPRAPGDTADLNMNGCASGILGANEESMARAREAVDKLNAVRAAIQAQERRAATVRSDDEARAEKERQEQSTADKKEVRRIQAEDAAALQADREARAKMKLEGEEKATADKVEWFRDITAEGE